MSCKALAPRGKTDSLSTSTQPSENQRDSAAEFMYVASARAILVHDRDALIIFCSDKHFVEDKLELPVLDFLEMMLG